MAFNTPNNFSTAYQCGEDLSSNQFQFVSLHADHTLYASHNTDIPLGILTDIPSVGPLGQFSGTVVTAGTTRICVAAAYPIGTWLVPYFDGTTYGVGASIATAGSPEEFIRARTLQESAAPGDIVSCELVFNPFGASGDTGAVGAIGATGANGITGIQGLNSLVFGGVTGTHIADWAYLMKGGVTGVIAWYSV